jgi:hypothetical protein
MELKNHVERGHIGHDGYDKFIIGNGLWQGCCVILLLAYIQPKLIASIVDSMCNNLYGNILFCSMIFQAQKRVHVHTRRTVARDLCEIVK